MQIPGTRFVIYGVVLRGSVIQHLHRVAEEKLEVNVLSQYIRYIYGLVANQDLL